MLTASEVLQLIQSLIWLLAGVGVFIVGMNFMGDALEKSAGSGMKKMLEKISNNRFSGVGIGAGVTAIIQSSSATSVMVIGLVNAGVMTLMQATPIIMGANIGTTITGVLVALKNDIFNMIMYLLAFAGVMMSFFKDERVKIAGNLCSGLGLIFVGLEVMSSDQAFGNELVERLFTEIFKNVNFPLLLILVGIIFTAFIQSSSAATGVVITMVGTGVLPLDLALFIVLGANIGTCVTALLASVGANVNSKRVALIHFTFNVIGTVLFTTLIWIFKDAAVNLLVSVFPGNDPMSLQMRVSLFHVVFNVTTTAALLPFTKYLVKYSTLVIKDKKVEEKHNLLDRLLIATPAAAIQQCRAVTSKMAETSLSSIKSAFSLLTDYDDKVEKKVREDENTVDIYEDELGSYLLELSAQDMSARDSVEVTKILHLISDLERLSDHAVNIAESAREMHQKKLAFSPAAYSEVSVLIDAVNEILDYAFHSFKYNSIETADKVEPLEEVIDRLQAQIKLRHINRLKNNECTIELGFILTDLLTDIERIADHCSNIAGCVIEIAHNSLGMHSYTQSLKSGNADYDKAVRDYGEKYVLPVEA
ncbi:MAG: Na/Pi cotransporter family protein [Clostridia bacterium]|nr:Na/Pi cotransporter family protein [Clostridia bacterium]